MPYIDKIKIGNTSYDIKGDGAFLPLAGGTMDAGVSVTFHDNDEKYQSVINDNVIEMNDLTDEEVVVIAPEAILISDASQNAEIVPSGVFFTPSANTTTASITASHDILNNESTMTISAANIIIKGLPALDSSSSWRTALGLGSLATVSKNISDSTGSGALLNTSSNLVTERDVYYGLPQINGVHTYNSATTIYAPTTAGTNGQVLMSTGSTVPSWKTTSDSSEPVHVTTSTSLITARAVYYGLPYINNSHTYNSSDYIYAPTAMGTSGQMLISNGNSTPSWATVTIPTITLNGTATATASLYAPTAAGTADQVLISNGSGAPSWRGERVVASTTTPGSDCLIWIDIS